MPEMDFSVVLLPTPLPPSRATQPPPGTARLTPLMARTTPLYIASTLESSSMCAQAYHFLSVGTGKSRATTV